MIIKASNISFSYGNKEVLRDINFSIQSGDMFAVLGPNAAGKTTLTKILSGVLEMQHGHLNAIDLDTIGFLKELEGIFLKMTGFEYLSFVATLYKCDPNKIEERIYYLAKQFHFTTELHKQVKKYSLGTKKKLEICAAIFHKPSILLLDEPFESIDPIVCHDLKLFLKEYANMGNIVIITSHILEIIQNLCTKYIIIDKGYVVSSGNINEDQDHIEHIYMEVIKNEECPT